MPSTRIIGIDFGTHKTLVTRWDAERQQPVLIRLRPAHGDDMPTSVHVSAEGQLTFGDEAEAAASTDAENIVRGFKRDLGTHSQPYYVNSHEFTPKDLSREYLHWLKGLVETESLHGTVNHAVITVPASWLPPARQELLTAATEAGFASVELLDEPAAAGLAFLSERRDLWTEGALLVFDWGAGTLDLAVLTLKDGQPQVIASLVGGKPTLGGHDIDRHLLEMVNRRLAQSGQQKLDRRDPQERELVRGKVNEWKIRHSTKAEAIWRLERLHGVPPEANLEWTSAEIGDRVKDKLTEAVNACGELIERAQAQGVVPAGILLVGGSSQFPALRAILEERFAPMRLMAWDQRITAVAIGAVLKAVKGNSPDAAPALLDEEVAIVIGEKVEVKYRKNYLSPEPPLVPSYDIGGRFGLINQRGESIISPCWEGMEHPSEGLVGVKINERWGYADGTGKLIIPPQWESIDPFREGLACVGLEAKNPDVKKLISLLDKGGVDFTTMLEGSGIGLRYGYIDKSGRMVITPDYFFASNFFRGLAKVELSGKSGLIDKTGKRIVPCEFDSVPITFSEGLGAACRNGKHGFIDNKGQVIIPLQYDNAGSFSRGLANVESNSKWGFIDRLGSVAIPLQSEMAFPFSEDLALVQRNGKWGFIDRTGNAVFPLEWDDARPFCEGLASVTRGGKCGYIDKLGQVAIPLAWDSAENFGHGFARVKLDGKFGLLDRSGKVVISPDWDDLRIDSGNTAWNAFVLRSPDETIESNQVGGGNLFYLLIRIISNEQAGVAILNRQLVAIWKNVMPVAFFKADKHGSLQPCPPGEPPSLPAGPPPLPAASAPVTVVAKDPWEESLEDGPLRTISEIRQRFSVEQEAVNWSAIQTSLKKVGVTRMNNGRLELFETDRENLREIVRICENAPLTLDVYGDDWRDHDFIHLSRLTCVRIIILGGCGRLTDESLASISKMHSLKALEFTNPGEKSRMSIDGFCALSKIQGLRFLEFPNPLCRRSELSQRERRSMKNLLMKFAANNPHLRTDPELDDFQDD
jgi:actin-like ATPase involved in cell morphogenesis